jgi:hypothetical protein
MLVTDTPEIDLGSLKYRQVHEFTYTLRNTSSEPLRVTRIVAGCSSCTHASAPGGDIKPGETAPLKVTFTPGNLGRNVKRLHVFYGPNNKELILKFKAQVDA